MSTALKRYLARHHIGLLALFVALSGTAYAASELDKNEVKSKHIKAGAVKNADLASNAVTSPKVANGSLLSEDFAAGQLPAGPQGAQGAPATKLWAVVDQTGALLRGSGAVSSAKVLLGGYEIIFNQDVSACSYSATLGDTAAEEGLVGVGPRFGQPNGAFVLTNDAAAAAEDHGFNVQVFC